ncbi:MAG: hypothetical protein ACLFPU_10930 [Dehalococcoidia bacterium]
MILIVHEGYIQTVAYWEGPDIRTYAFRPAREDSLVYDKARSVLSVVELI